jgi:hypothetical protein
MPTDGRKESLVSPPQTTAECSKHAWSVLEPLSISETTGFLTPRTHQLETIMNLVTFSQADPHRHCFLVRAANNHEDKCHVGGGSMTGKQRIVTWEEEKSGDAQMSS